MKELIEKLLKEFEDVTEYGEGMEVAEATTEAEKALNQLLALLR